MKAECVSEKDIPIDEYSQQAEDGTKLPTGIFEDQEACRVPEHMRLWNEISQKPLAPTRNEPAFKLLEKVPVERVKTPVQVESKATNLVKNLAAPFKYKNTYLDLKPDGKQIDNETLELLQKVLDKKPNFTNNYVNFNRPETFAA